MKIGRLGDCHLPPAVCCLLLWVGLLLVACAPGPSSRFRTLPADDYLDRVEASWKASLIANHNGLALQGVYLEEPGPGPALALAFPDQWSTDDDTMIEWIDLRILETYGLEPSNAQIRDAWIAYVNNDIWVSTRRARDLMDQGLLPPETGSPQHNPDGAWSIDAQLETELFGLLAPGLPGEAARRAARFAQITNRGPAVEASAFYATLYSLAFFEDHVPTLIAEARARFPDDAIVSRIVDDVTAWRTAHPEDWRATRRRIRDKYDTDPQWWASRVNFAATIMALLYGRGDLERTVTIAGLAGWDADNNMTTAAGLLGVLHGSDGLPPAWRGAADLYFNEDGTGDLPPYETVPEIARRTQRLAEQAIRQAGGRVQGRLYWIPLTQEARP